MEDCGVRVYVAWLRCSQQLLAYVLTGGDPGARAPVCSTWLVQRLQWAVDPTTAALDPSRTAHSEPRSTEGALVAACAVVQQVVDRVYFDQIFPRYDDWGDVPFEAATGVSAATQRNAVAAAGCQPSSPPPSGEAGWSVAGGVVPAAAPAGSVGRQNKRFYHTLRHLDEMLLHWERYRREAGAAHGAEERPLDGPRAPPNDPSHPAPAGAGTGLTSEDDSVAAASGCHLEEELQIGLSVFFHDVVYDATRGDNEEQSAELFTRSFGEVLHAVTAALQRLEGVALPEAPPGGEWCAYDQLDRRAAAVASGLGGTVVRFILQTKEHMAYPAAADGLVAGAAVGAAAALPCRAEAIQIFLDLDLAVLGRDEARYATYAGDIQREYRHYAAPDFCRGRAAFLRSFLAAPRWYKTTFFFVDLEATARRNVAEEVARLEKQLAA